MAHSDAERDRLPDLQPEDAEALRAGSLAGRTGLALLEALVLILLVVVVAMIIGRL